MTTAEQGVLPAPKGDHKHTELPHSDVLIPPPQFQLPSRLYASKTGLNVCTVVIRRQEQDLSAAILESRFRDGQWHSSPIYEVLGSAEVVESYIRNTRHKMEAGENCLEFPSIVYEVTRAGAPHPEFVHQTIDQYGTEKVVLSWNFQLTPAGPVTIAISHGEASVPREDLRRTLVASDLRRHAIRHSMIGLRG